MKIYTKTGDTGQTSLSRGGRVAKDDLRVETYGSIDELNAFIGLALCDVHDAEIAQILLRLQSECFIAGAELATKSDSNSTPPEMAITEDFIQRLECEIDSFAAQMPPLTQFILPGGSRAAAAIHVARTVCRRAERRIVELSKSEYVSDKLLKYINRLSDHLFMLARFTNKTAEIADTPWAQSPRFNKLHSKGEK
jgi:cob(I)alamin adenosyltransferase